MTDDDTTHLADELLSAVLDGEADVEASTHTDACDRCRARLATLRDVSVLVAAPVPPADPARRDAAIEAALAAMDGTVVPLRRRRTPPAWLAAAAAIAVAVGAVSLVSRGGDDSGFDTATGGSSERAADSTSDLDMFAAPAAEPVDGGDLGEVDGDTLRQRIEEAVGAQRNGAIAESAEAPSAEDAATMQAAAPVPCEQEVRGGSPQLGGLVYRATGTFEGVSVIVLAFDVPPDRWVYVVTLDGCTIKNQQTYSP